mgnify:FL=1
MTANDVRTGLLTAENPGRFQVLPGQPLVILDVAHNPHAARALAGGLKSLPRGGRTLAVFAMLSDKDVAGVIAVLKPLVAQWFVAGLSGPRGGTAEALAEKLAAAGVTAVACFADVEAALQAARDVAGVDDKIIVFGSFYTVSEAMQAVQKLQTRPLKT